MAEKPKFWRRAKLTVNSDNYQEVLQGLRVLMVSEIEIDDLDDSDDASSPILAILENLFAAVLNGSSHLKSLKFKCSEDLRALDPVLLSQSLIRLEE